jgi:hypothetical protein
MAKKPDQPARVSCVHTSFPEHSEVLPQPGATGGPSSLQAFLLGVMPPDTTEGSQSARLSLLPHLWGLGGVQLSSC